MAVSGLSRDRVPGHDGSGHGALLASVILDGASPPDLEPFRVDRFL